MFDEFTERARKVMSLARQEAQRLNSEFIGSEHILLGIIQEGRGVAAKVFENLNVDLKRIRQEADKLVTPSTSPIVTMGQLPFSPVCKKIIERAAEECAQLQSGCIGTEHLLLALCSVKEGICCQVLAGLKISVEEVRASTLKVIEAAKAEVPTLSSIAWDKRPVIGVPLKPDSFKVSFFKKMGAPLDIGFVLRDAATKDAYSMDLEIEVKWLPEELHETMLKAIAEKNGYGFYTIRKLNPK